jgi:hypothetical protein
MATLLTILRIIHVVGAVIWAGWAFTNTAFLAPAVKASGPAGGAVMGNILKTTLLKVMIIVPLLVVTAGVIMYWYYSGNLSIEYLTSFRGLALTLGALAGLIAFIEGMLVTGPTARKMAAIGDQIQQGGGSPSPEQLAQMGVLRERLSSAGLHGTILLTAALVGMALGTT